MQEYFIVLFPAFVIGILHTLMPCEDKAIFFFWSFGISKNVKNSLLILILYGLGLIGANMSIAFITVILTFIPRLLGSIPKPYVINFFGAFSSTFAAVFLLFFIMRRDYAPHNYYKDELIKLNWEKKRTPFFFGMLAGYPPCVFELFIYSQSFTCALSYGSLEGIITVFYFSLGTFIGLFPLALAKQGTSKVLRGEKKEQRRNKLYFLMLLIIIIFNIIIMILSFLRIELFNVSNI
ncbi:MAG: sulfite exporter TauE/SafE family protein [Promethearchaeia archaeon]